MSQNQYLFDRAKQVIPGGVNSPVRAFKGVDGTPPFIKRGQGPYLFDEEGKRYLDYVCSWGALILGHAHPEVTKAMQQAMENGSSFGAPTLLEIKLAEKICQLVPSVEMIRMVNSGTEATISAIRLARAFTRKNKIIKFAGCYHGHADALLVQAGSGVLTLGIPSTPGIPSKVTEDTLVANFNNLNDTEQLFQTYGQDIAAVIIEPVACNMNCILPQPGFLSVLRTLCNDYHSLLIFDEVITGFRLGLAGAQGYFGIEPDLTTFGKIIGGGMPVGAYGGKKVIMEHMAPVGSVYQAGTLSGNPVAMSTGLATLELISKPGFYTQLESQTGKLVNGISELAQQAKIPLHINHIGSIFGLFFTEQTEINCFAQVKQCHLENFQRFFHAMLNEGIYLAPSAFEAGFITAAHGDEEINQTLLATEKALYKIRT